ncbi:tyrosine-type recombinase/integrase [Victivallis vadensis]|uniref:tyrosine-type recombinase/integrase n=1 Tax=Victivallis vadensis TaxID=172901 RepID=UPI003AF81015
MKARELTADETARLLAYFKERGERFLATHALLLVMVVTGARISEILKLKRADFLDASGRLRTRITRRQLKTRNEKKFISKPLQAVVTAPLLEWFDWQKRHLGAVQKDFAFATMQDLSEPSRGALYKRMKAACSALGIDPRGVSPHSTRKTFAMIEFRAWMEKTGSTMHAAHKVQRLLGHGDINTTLAYLGVNDDDSELLLDRVGEFLQGTISAKKEFQPVNSDSK